MRAVGSRTLRQHLEASIPLDVEAQTGTDVSPIKGTVCEGSNSPGAVIGPKLMMCCVRSELSTEAYTFGKLRALRLATY